MVNFDDILNQFKEAYKTTVELAGHSASGNLVKSMTFETKIKKDSYLVVITLPEYALYLEEGTKPHWPPISAIKKWIKIKRILPRPMKNGKLPTEDLLAFLIGRKISKFGTPATHMIANTMSQFLLVNKLKTRLADSIKKELVDELSITATIK